MRLGTRAVAITGRGQLAIPVPRNPFFAGLDFAMQLAVPGTVAGAPPVSAPPRRHFTIR